MQNSNLEKEYLFDNELFHANDLNVRPSFETKEPATLQITLEHKNHTNIIM